MPFDPDIARANAKLIAAAPLLLEACKHAEAELDLIVRFQVELHPNKKITLQRTIETLRTATAKAGGAQ